MKARLSTLAVAAALVLTLMSSEIVAETASRIELNDSTVYLNVEYDVDLALKVITVVGRNFDVPVSFTAVRLIVDKDGRDVTERRLGLFYRGPVQPLEQGHFIDAWGKTISAPEDDSSRSDSEAEGSFRPFRLGLRLSGNFSQPMGGWYSAAKEGVGYDLDLVLALDRHVAIRLSYSKSGVEHDAVDLFGEYEPFLDELDWDVSRYFASLQLFHWPQWREDGQEIYYAYTGVGAVSHRLTGHAVAYDYVNDEYFETRGELPTETSVAINVGAGFGLLIAGPVVAECAAELDVVFAGNGSDGGMAYLADIKLGLGYCFR